jgi:hypothetical protein
MTLAEAGCSGSASAVLREIGVSRGFRPISGNATSLASSLVFSASLKCFCLHDLSRTLHFEKLIAHQLHFLADG